jgi:hypothetical protein
MECLMSRYIDQGRNPDAFSRDIVESALAVNAASADKLNLFYVRFFLLFYFTNE